MIAPKTPESSVYTEPTSFGKAKSWKWENKYWLLVLAVSCLLLFWFGSQLKEMPLIQQTIDYLPALGSLVLVGDKLLKLI